ncbi:hypothetical protein ACN09X_04755 [Aliarcobacter butzleri]|uniref:Uncharacterized protein n=1 Tax=Aliarcobacter butzleri TaxID=28197 RepID=A0AAW7PZJ2_9BACT|nr:hypothetical protein [Aliarcobacter butzleri]MDN5071436.1 hypothetical protein [Aliarcobacter butzleri]
MENLDIEITPNFPYEIDPATAEELGAFREDAIFQEDVEEAIEGEA